MEALAAGDDLEAAVDAAIAACDSNVRATDPRPDRLEQLPACPRRTPDGPGLSRFCAGEALADRPAVKESILWWLRYLRIFALNSPWGTAVRFTIWIHAYEGQQLAEIWKTTPIDVIDGYGRKCQMIETKDKTITIQWAVHKPSGYGGPTATWGAAAGRFPRLLEHRGVFIVLGSAAVAIRALRLSIYTARLDRTYPAK